MFASKTVECRMSFETFCENLSVLARNGFPKILTLSPYIWVKSSMYCIAVHLHSTSNFNAQIIELLPCEFSYNALLDGSFGSCYNHTACTGRASLRCEFSCAALNYPFVYLSNHTACIGKASLQRAFVSAY